MILLLALLPFAAQASLPTELSHIYSYQCEATFLEGEGITPYEIFCPAHQRLGWITAKYTHFLFSSGSGNNFSEKGTEDWYNQPLCGLPTRRFSCNDSAPQLEFGLARNEEGPYLLRVILTSSNRGISRLYGFAAAPLANGKCPEGLVHASMFEAKPRSIEYPLPSSFVNYRNNRNDHRLALRSEPPADFKVYREASKRPCDSQGNCREADFNPRELAQSAPYVALSSVICVIPKEAMSPDK